MARKAGVAHSENLFSTCRAAAILAYRILLSASRYSMKAGIAYVLVALMLLQTFSREVLVVDYALR